MICLYNKYKNRNIFSTISMLVDMDIGLAPNPLGVRLLEAPEG